MARSNEAPDLIMTRSAKELAEMTGTTAACVLSSISHGHKGWERVEVEDDDAEVHEMRRQDLR